MTGFLSALPWRHRWQQWRDRRLADPAFREAASRFWFTRPIARRSARALFDLMAGFVYSQVLLGCVRLRWFAQLAEGPLPLATLAQRARLDLDAAARLADAAVALQLLERRGEAGLGLGPLGAAMVGDEGLAAVVEHHAVLYEDLRDPLALLRGDTAPAAAAAPGERTAGVRPAGSLSGYWPYAGHRQPAALAPAQVATYSALMAASQPMVARAVIAAEAPGRHRAWLDVGGGDGRFLVEAARAAPALQLVLADLPAVVERARQRFAGAGVLERASLHGLDFHRDPLPTGADIASLIRVLHDHDDRDVLRLLRAVHAALPPGGTLLVAEPMAGTAGAEPMGDAYFGFYLLAMGRGRPRSAETLTDMLRRCGFDEVRRVPTAVPLQAQVLRARRA